EPLYRDAIKILQPLGERGHLCENQRMLAQILAERGKLDEAERVALAARETVGPEDVVSQLTTAMALGVVRSAQGRDEEAARLLGSAVDGLHRSAFRSSEPEALRYLIRFLRERGRTGEAVPYEARLAELDVSEPVEETPARIAGPSARRRAAVGSSASSRAESRCASRCATASRASGGRAAHSGSRRVFPRSASASTGAPPSTFASRTKARRGSSASARSAAGRSTTSCRTTRT